MITTEAMKEKPILFSGEMVKAILASRKTQTRRLVKPQPETFRGERGTEFVYGDCLPVYAKRFAECYSRWRPGTRLWVRETWRTMERDTDMADGVLFAADNAFVVIENTREAADQWVDAHDNGKHGTKWRPSIFMPRWASRITLEITDVRVERLQDISQADAQAEGVERPVLSPEFIQGVRVHPMTGPYRDGFKELWERINGPVSWDANPWVWVIEFKRLTDHRIDGGSGLELCSSAPLCWRVGFLGWESEYATCTEFKG